MDLLWLECYRFAVFVTLDSYKLGLLFFLRWLWFWLRLLGAAEVLFHWRLLFLLVRWNLLGAKTRTGYLVHLLKHLLCEWFLVNIHLDVEVDWNFALLLHPNDICHIHLLWSIEWHSWFLSDLLCAALRLARHWWFLLSSHHRCVKWVIGKGHSICLALSYSSFTFSHNSSRVLDRRILGWKQFLLRSLFS